MSRSDRDQRGRKLWEQRAGELRWLRSLYNRTDRRRAKRDLHKGDQPNPLQPRGRAKWDLW